MNIMFATLPKSIPVWNHAVYFLNRLADSVMGDRRFAAENIKDFPLTHGLGVKAYVAGTGRHAEHSAAIHHQNTSPMTGSLHLESRWHSDPASGQLELRWFHAQNAKTLGTCTLAMKGIPHG